VTYHDPCYLGSIMASMTNPEVLKKIPGLELKEMAKCGKIVSAAHGGRQVWMETAKGEISDLRLEQAIGVGAEVLAIPARIASAIEDSRLTLKITRPCK